MLIKNTFRFKLFFSYVFIVIISFGVIAFFLDKNLENESLKVIEASLISQARLIENQITAENLKKEDTSYLDGFVKKIRDEVKCRLTIINLKGKVLADSEEPREFLPKLENHRYRPEVMAALEGRIGSNMRYSKTLKIDMLYVALPITDKGSIIGVLRLALPLVSVEAILSTIRKTVLKSFILAVLLAFIVGSLLARSIANPINKIIQVSRNISEGDFSHRIFLNSKDEIRKLADTINQMAQDIEDKLKKIQTQNQRLKAVLDSMIEGVIVVDKSGVVISANPAIEKIFDIKIQDVEGNFFLESIRNNDIAELIALALKEGQFISRELKIVLPAQKTFQVNVSAVFDQEGQVSGCLAVVHDITELKRLETVRSDFVANVSHELKTPLTSIKGFIETLLEGALEDKENSREFLKIIQNHTERLDNLINDLLSLSHIESREIKLKIDSINLHDLVNKIYSGFRSQIKKRSIEVKNGLPVDSLIRADVDRVEQVLTNLIGNAIKFNKEKGSINIYSEDSKDSVKIIVEDSGIGIPPKDIPRRFERFYRVDKARSRELGGTGLGLSIVKHIVELHGGNVGLESVEGLGSKFWFTLPK